MSNKFDELMTIEDMETVILAILLIGGFSFTVVGSLIVLGFGPTLLLLGLAMLWMFTII
jgi:hypothetical protein